MAKENKLGKEEYGYVICNGLSKIIEMFVSTFLVAYLLNLSNGNFFEVSLYYLFVYLGMIVFYSLFSFFLHRINKLIFYRTSILLKCAFLILIALLKENIVNYIIPISLLYSVQTSLYWSSYNAMMNGALNSNNIHKFYGVYNICAYIVNIAAPIALGGVIELGSFIKTAIYAFVICLMLFFATFLMVSRKEKGNDLVIGQFVDSMKENKKSYLKCYLTCFLNGVRTSTSTIITILIVLTFKSNVSLGSLSSIMSLISVFVLFLFMKKYTSKYSKVILICIGLCLLGIMGMLLDISKATIIIFNVLYTISMIIPDNLYSQRRVGLLKITDKHAFILEHNLLCEACLNIGRVISYLILLISSFYSSIHVYKVLLLINLVAIFAYCLGVYYLERKCAGISLQNDTIERLKEVEKDCVGYYHYKGELRKEIKNVQVDKK